MVNGSETIFVHLTKGVFEGKLQISCVTPLNSILRKTGKLTENFTSAKLYYGKEIL